MEDNEKAEIDDPQRKQELIHEMARDMFEAEIDDPAHERALVQETAQEIFDVTTVVDVSGNVSREEPTATSEEHEEGQGEVGIESDIPVAMETRQQDLFEFGDLSKIYGAFQRGCVAKTGAPPGTPVLLEDAMIWVCAPLPEDLADDSGNFPDVIKLFFLPSPARPNWYTLPKEMLEVLGGFHVALTALVILRQPFMAEVYLGEAPDFPGLFGHHDSGNYCSGEEAYEVAQKFFFQPALAEGKKLETETAEESDEAPSEKRARIVITEEELAKWPLERFVRLYSVMQTNALKGYRPLDTELFGVGMFSATCFFNHSCNPNAVMHLQPGKVCIQLVRPVETGDEITVSYKEIVADILCPNVCRLLHVDMGIGDSRGCLCEMCRSMRVEEETLRKLDNTSEDTEAKPTAEIIDVPVVVDWLANFNPETRQQLDADQRLLTAVKTIIQNSRCLEAVIFSDQLKEHYVHLLEYADGDKTRGRLPEGQMERPKGYTYLPDLALMMGELFCYHTIHLLPEVWMNLKKNYEPRRDDIRRQRLNIKQNLKDIKKQKKELRKAGKGISAEQDDEHRKKKKMIKKLNDKLDTKEHEIDIEEERARQSILESLQFWPRVYHKAVLHSLVFLPNTQSGALLARCYGEILRCGLRSEDDRTNRKRDTDALIQHWITLRSLHMQVFGHTEYLWLPRMSYPVLSNVISSVNGTIEAREKEVETRRLEMEEKEKQRIETMVRAEEERRKREEAALAEQERQAMNDALATDRGKEEEEEQDTTK